jgi:hypothetical protein
VLHCPDFIAPLRRPCPAVVTIHDLAFLHYPDILDDAARAYYGQIARSTSRADGIIAVSEATRQDIAQFLDIPIEEIAVIYEAAAPMYTRQELREGEARVLGSTPVAADTFMLFVSTLEPRKNLPTLLHALRICIDRRPDRPYRLVVAGSRGWRDEQIYTTARDLRLGEHVLFVGAIGQYDLRWLYNACRLYINPSLYEGFGLPLLEAMACGAACLAAATSSLPEIGGNAALYVPPLDVGMWADAIEALWDDQERREELGRLGQGRAARFSWRRAARETLKLYEHAIERAAGRATPAYAPTPDRSAEPADGALAFEPGERRTCLRCGAAMLASQLQHGILVAEAAQADDKPVAARAWLCPRCGHVELVAEQAIAPADEQPAEALAPEALAESLDLDLSVAPTIDLASGEQALAEGLPEEDAQLALGAADSAIDPAEIAGEEPLPAGDQREAADAAAAQPEAESPELELAGEEEGAPIGAEPAKEAPPGVAETLVFELPHELAQPNADLAAAEEEEILAPPEEPPGPAITQQLERPFELILPDLAAPLHEVERDLPASEADHDSAGHHGGARNGTAPDALNGAAPKPDSEPAAAQPKRQRQSRSKRKRSP